MREHIEGRTVSPSTYNNYGCRCDGCRDANNKRMAQYRGKAGRNGESIHTMAARITARWVRENHPDVWESAHRQATEINQRKKEQ